MVGIILGSHGDFAKGILQSSTMIFGQQEKLVAVTLQPSQGPEDIKQQYVEAIESMNCDQVLFLVDLWGGTPFNQANLIWQENQDKYAIVSGLNLGMLLEALATRFSSESSHEIASKIISSAKDSIQSQPSEFKISSEESINESDNEVTSSLDRIEYVLARVDSRLLHGQVATGWCKTCKPNRILVVGDKVAHDNLRKKMIMQAAPVGIKANCIPLSKLVEVDKDKRFNTTKALVLFENLQDAYECIKQGVHIDTINLGSIAHSDGKKVVNSAISMDTTDLQTYQQLLDMNIAIDIRKVPSDSPIDQTSLLNKAKEVLSE